MLVEGSEGPSGCSGKETEREREREIGLDPPAHAGTMAGEYPYRRLSAERSPFSPTDDDLVQALEDFERQAEEERLKEARAEEEPGETALNPGASSTEGHEEAERGEHRRRRFLAAALED